MNLEILKKDGVTSIIDTCNNNKVFVKLTGEKKSISRTFKTYDTLYSVVIDELYNSQLQFKNDELYHLASLIKWEYPRNKINFQAQFYEIEICNLLDSFFNLTYAHSMPKTKEDMRALILKRFRLEKEVHTKELRVIMEKLVLEKLTEFSIIY